MNASKESCRKAARFFKQIASGGELTEHGKSERINYIEAFLDAAERRLPTEESFERQKQKRRSA